MRINLWGGPNSGKSRTASRIFGDPSLCNIRLELVQEFVKAWAYEGKKITGFDQVKIFGEQLHKEELVLKHSKDTHLITDSPLGLQVFYSQKNLVPAWESLFAITKEFDKNYPSINILLDKGEILYDNVGRYETESESKQIAKEIRAFLIRNDIIFEEFYTVDYYAILEYVKYKLGKENENGR